jgi:hypothetical protein
MAHMTTTSSIYRPLDLVQSLNSLMNQGSEFALVLMVGGEGSRTWPLIGYPMYWATADGKINFSGKVLSRFGVEGNALEIALRRLHMDIPVYLVCPESQYMLFEVWKKEYQTQFPGREITIVVEPEPGMDTGGGLRYALDRITTPYVVTMYGDAYFNSLEIYRQCCYTQLDFLRYNQNCIGVLMGVVQQDFNPEFGYFLLESGVREGRSAHVIGWTDKAKRASQVSGWHINPGLYAFRVKELREKMDLLQPLVETDGLLSPPRYSLESDILPILVKEGRLRGFVAPFLHWDDLGQPRSFWIHRFFGSGTNHLGNQVMTERCHHLVAHSGFNDIRLAIRGFENAIVTLTAFPGSPILFVIPSEWIHRAREISGLVELIRESEDHLFTYSVDKDVHLLPDQVFQPDLVLPEELNIKVWAAIPVSLKFTHSLFMGKGSWLIEITCCGEYGSAKPMEIPRWKKAVLNAGRVLGELLSRRG